MRTAQWKTLAPAALWLWAAAAGLFVAALLVVVLSANRAESGLLAGLGLGISTATSIMVVATRTPSK